MGNAAATGATPESDEERRRFVQRLLRDERELQELWESLLEDVEDSVDSVDAAQLQPLTQRLIDRLGCRHPSTLERIAQVYDSVADRQGLSVVEFNGYVACVLTQILRELEARVSGTSLEPFAVTLSAEPPASAPSPKASPPAPAAAPSPAAKAVPEPPPEPLSDLQRLALELNSLKATLDGKALMPETPALPEAPALPEPKEEPKPEKVEKLEKLEKVEKVEKLEKVEKESEVTGMTELLASLDDLVFYTNHLAQTHAPATPSAPAASPKMRVSPTPALPAELAAVPGLVPVRAVPPPAAVSVSPQTVPKRLAVFEAPGAPGAARAALGAPGAAFGAAPGAVPGAVPGALREAEAPHSVEPVFGPDDALPLAPRPEPWPERQGLRGAQALQLDPSGGYTLQTSGLTAEVMRTASQADHVPLVDASDSRPWSSRLSGASTGIAYTWQAFADAMDSIFVPPEGRAEEEEAQEAPEAPAEVLEAHPKPEAPSDVPLIFRQPTVEEVLEVLQEEGLPAYVAIASTRSFSPKKLCLDSSYLYVLEPDSSIPAVFFGMHGFCLDDLRRIVLGEAFLDSTSKPLLSLEFEDGFLPVRLGSAVVLVDWLEFYATDARFKSCKPHEKWKTCEVQALS